MQVMQRYSKSKRCCKVVGAEQPDPVAAEGGSATIEAVAEVVDAGVSTFISEEIAQSERPELTAAGVIISGGRGMQSGDNFTLLEGADKLGAAIGASRAQ